MEECSVFGERHGIQYGRDLQCEGTMETGQAMSLGRLGGAR